MTWCNIIPAGGRAGPAQATRNRPATCRVVPALRRRAVWWPRCDSGWAAAAFCRDSRPHSIGMHKQAQPTKSSPNQQCLTIHAHQLENALGCCAVRPPQLIHCRHKAAVKLGRPSQARFLCLGCRVGHCRRAGGGRQGVWVREAQGRAHMKLAGAARSVHVRQAATTTASHAPYCHAVGATMPTETWSAARQQSWLATQHAVPHSLA